MPGEQSPPRLFRIRASAGSGKTHELTGRVLRRLADGGGNPDGILAVTFTNAAAAEMRDRVLRRLKEIALGLAREPGLDRARAGLLVENLVANMGRLNIRTIDSLLQRIIRAAALDLGLSPNFTPVFSEEEAVRPHLDLFMQRIWIGDPSFKDHAALLERVFHVLAERGPDGRIAKRGFLARDTLDRAMEQLLPMAFRGDLDDDDVILDREDVFQDAIRAAQDAAADLNTRVKEDGWGGKYHKLFLKAIAKMAVGMCNYDSEYWNKDACVVKKNQRASDSCEKAFAGLKEKIRLAVIARNALLIAPLARLALLFARAHEANLRQEESLPSVRMEGLAVHAMEEGAGASDVLIRMGSALKHVFIDEFQDTSRGQWEAIRPLVTNVLAAGGAFTWVGDVKQAIYGWRGGDAALFDSILKDERITAPVPAPEKDKRITAPVPAPEKDKRITAPVPAPEKDSDPDILKFNWRSRRVVVEFNNRLFAPLASPAAAEDVLRAMLPGKDGDIPADLLLSAADDVIHAFDGADQELPGDRDVEGGHVACVPIDVSDADAEAAAEHPDGDDSDGCDDESGDAASVSPRDALVLEQLLAAVKEMARIRPWSDILILVRANREARMAAQRLLDENIPVVTENSLLLAEHPLVRQLVAFLAFLAAPDDDVSFWSVITGSILAGLPGIPPAGALHDWRAEDLASHEAARAPLWMRFRDAWPEAWNGLIRPFFHQAGLMTPYDILMEWCARCGVLRRFPDDAAFIRRFMEVVHRAEAAGMSGLPLFLRHWEEHGDEEKIPMPEGMDAVRIMTIHKSKGLEAPAVIVPWLTAVPRAEGHAVVPFGDGRALVRLKKEIGRPYAEELCRQAREGLHLLYVAFTRAREDLRIFHFVNEKRRKAGLGLALKSLLAAAGLKDGHESGVPSAGGGGAAPEPEGPPASPSVSLLKDEPPAPEDADADADVRERAADFRPMDWMPRLKVWRTPLKGLAGGSADAAAERGTLMHACLENLVITGSPEDDAERAILAVRHALPPVRAGLMDELREDLRSAVIWFASLQDAARWLQNGVPEQPLIDGDGNLLRADLMVREDWGILILDYKSGREYEEKHLEQMRGYLSCLPEKERDSARALLVYCDRKIFRAVSLEAAGDPADDPAAALKCCGGGLLEAK